MAGSGRARSLPSPLSIPRFKGIHWTALKGIQRFEKETKGKRVPIHIGTCLHNRRIAMAMALRAACALPRGPSRASVQGKRCRNVSCAAGSSQEPEGAPGGALAAGAVALGATLFFVAKLGNGVDLDTLANSSTPLEVASRNGKPSVVEFYADWCEVCKELAPQVYEVEQEYGDRVNFVLLNIENSKWAPEVSTFRVDGVPHFVFLDGEGKDRGEAIGKLPRNVLEGNVQALAENREELPFSKVTGVTSSLADAPSTGSSPAPRDHS